MVMKSVAMATYNGEKYISEQMESILRQTVPVQEVCICDDGSSDRTVEIIRDFIKSNHLENTWKLFVNDKNIGYASNFIHAVEKTSGELVFFCDQDDIWISDRVERMEKIMEGNPDILLLGSEFQPFSESKNARKVPAWELKQMKHDASLERLEFTPKNVFIGCQGCTMCVRRELLNRSLPYWFEGWAYDEFVWKTALCLDGLYVYHANTLERRLHEANTSLNKMHTLSVRIKFLEDLYRSHTATRRFLTEQNGSASAIQLLKKNEKAVQLRIDLLKNKHFRNTVPLALHYRECYHKKRAIPVEFVMAVKGK